VIVAPVLPSAPGVAFARLGPLPSSATLPGGSDVPAQQAPPSAADVLAAAKATEPANLRPQAVISPVIGWLQVAAQVPVKVYANGRLLGTGTSSRYRLPVGHHLITLANEEQGIRSSQQVEIAGGRTVLVALDSTPAPAAAQ
jgi:hypothetical protein